MKSLQVRRAAPPDSAGIVEVLEAVTADRIHSAIDHVWTVEQETRYLESLSPRDIFHVAVEAMVGIVGFQSLDLQVRTWRVTERHSMMQDFIVNCGLDRQIATT